MDAPTLVDSNIFTELLRRGSDPATELTAEVSVTDLATCGMVRVEVLRGVRIEKVRHRLADFFAVLQNVPTDNRMWEEAAEMAWRLDRQGWTIPAQDILIACRARRIGASVLTRDKHFRRIPGIVVCDWPEE